MSCEWFRIWFQPSSHLFNLPHFSDVYKMYLCCILSVYLSCSFVCADEENCESDNWCYKNVFLTDLVHSPSLIIFYRDDFEYLLLEVKIIVVPLEIKTLFFYCKEIYTLWVGYVLKHKKEIKYCVKQFVTFRLSHLFMSWWWWFGSGYLMLRKMLMLMIMEKQKDDSDGPGSDDNLVMLRLEFVYLKIMIPWLKGNVKIHSEIEIHWLK